MIDLEQLEKELLLNLEYSKTGYAALKLNPETYAEILKALSEAKEIIEANVFDYERPSIKEKDCIEWLSRYFPRKEGE